MQETVLPQLKIREYCKDKVSAQRMERRDSVNKKATEDSHGMYISGSVFGTCRRNGM